MDSNQPTFNPATLLTSIVFAGFVLAGGAVFALTRPGSAPVPPTQVVFSPADGCFYEQRGPLPSTKRTDRACVSAADLAAYKAGAPSLELTSQLRKDTTRNVERKQIFQAESARFEAEKNSPFLAFERRIKPIDEFLDKWCPHHVIARLL